SLKEEEIKKESEPKLENTSPNDEEIKKESEPETTSPNDNIISDYFNTDNINSPDTPVRLKMKLENPSEIKLNLINANPHLKDLDDSELQEIQKKTKRNKECTPDDFFKKNRHYLIMTDGGKPIYSRYGDEVENCGIFGTFSAMITKYTIFLSTSEEKENIHFICNDKNKMVFVKKGQLIFIAYSNKNDSVSLLSSQLEILYLQLLSILTSMFLNRLEDNPSQCLTAMSGTEVLFEQIIEYSQHTLISVLNSYPVLPLKIRNKIMKICEENRGSALMCIIMTTNEIIGISHSDIISVSATDILLIQNLILSNASLRLTESWVPLCLPGISPDGYLQLYCQFTEDKIGVCFVTEQIEPTFFMTFAEQFNKINQTLIQENLIDKILTFAVDTPDKEKEEKIKAMFEMSEDEIVEDLLLKFSKAFDAKENGDNRSSRSKTVDISKRKENFKINPNYPDIFFGLCWHKKKNQYFTINFSHNYKNMSRQEKEILKEYIVLIDKYKELRNNSENSKTEKEFLYLANGEVYCNVIYQYENLVLLASFNVFWDYEVIGNKAKEIM
ncbi:MAG: hypothetical protein MJ252_29920, partial [archaeon]|nr:hypothetical protein [archaeon]